MAKILPPLSSEEIVSHCAITQDTVFVERISLDAGAQDTRVFSYRVHETGVRFDATFFLFLDKDSSFSLDISSFLEGEQSESRLRVFLVLNEGARAVVRMHTHARVKQGVVHEEIRGLALGDYRDASFLPELTLLHDEISATHAASIVRLRDSDLVYLRSRGMGSEDARRCVVDAFLQRK